MLEFAWDCFVCFFVGGTGGSLGATSGPLYGHFVAHGFRTMPPASFRQAALQEETPSGGWAVDVVRCDTFQRWTPNRSGVQQWYYKSIGSKT